MTYYNAAQMQTEIERVIKATRADTLRAERERVSRAIFLHANTLADERCSESVLELLPHLYETQEAATDA